MINYLWQYLRICALLVLVTPNASGANPPLRIAMSGTYMPLHGYEQGHAVGLEADLGRALAKALGREPVFLGREALRSNSIDAVASGKVDVALSAITPTPERAAKVDFTVPYVILKYRLLGLPGKSSVRKGSRVAAVGGALQAVRGMPWQIVATEAASLTDALKSLRAGETDFVAAEDIAVMSALASDLKGLRLVKEPFGASPIAMAVPKGEAARYDALLKSMDDLLLRLADRWAVEPPEDVMESQRRSCAAGDNAACYRLGLRYTSGLSVSVDKKTAVDLLSKACLGGLPAACWALEPITNASSPSQRDASMEAARAERNKRYRAACAAGDAKWCALMDDQFLSGTDFFRDACWANRAKNEQMCLQFATNQQRCWSSNYCSDDVATGEFRKICDRGHQAGCVGLALVLRDGPWTIPRQPARSFELLAMACAKGNQDGCHEQGSMLDAGVGVKRDSKRAVELFRKACSAGNAEGCAKLGQAYERGRGIKANVKDAQALYRKACDNLNARGCGLLGQLLLDSPDGDRAAAQALLVRGCYWGSAEGCAGLATLADQRSDEKETLNYLAAACRLRNQAACRTIIEDFDDKSYNAPLELLRAHQALCAQHGEQKACKRASELEADWFGGEISPQ